MVKYHINARGIPSVCKAERGGCPFGGPGGDDNHFDSLQDAQEFADRENERNYGFMATDAKGEFVPDEFGVYNQSYDIHDERVFNSFVQHGDSLYSLPRTTTDDFIESSSRFTEINEHNVGDVFRGGFKRGGTFIHYSHNAFVEYDNDLPLDSTLEVEITQIEDDAYVANGNLYEREQTRADFDNEDDFNDYISDVPEKETKLNFVFTADDISKAYKDADKSDSVPGVMVDTVFKLISKNARRS